MASKVLRGATALAIVMGAAAIQSAVAQQTPAPTPSPSPTQTPAARATPAPAQTTTPAARPADQIAAPKPADAQDQERVVVLGSLNATRPQDAPRPVEVYSAEDLLQQGSLSNVDFIRSLTLSYGDDLAFGQSSPDVPTGAGFGNANLRGLGSNGTLVLMNGKNLAPWNGSYGADVNVVPMEALEAVEVLKDGASAQYGAGAVGGVINFRTRRDINAPRLTVEKTMYDGSEGAYKVDFLTGWSGDSSNLLVSLSHSYEAPMLQYKRDFGNRPFEVDPAMWTLTGNNPGLFQPMSTDFHLVSATPIPIATSLYPGIVDLRASSRSADCAAIGGRILTEMQPGANFSTGFPNPICAYPQAYLQNLVNENVQSRAYMEFNADITDTLAFNVNVTYSQSTTKQNRTPSDVAGAATAIDRKDDATGGRRGFSSNVCFGCNYVVPVQVQNFSAAGAPLGTFVRNPFIDDFMTRTGTTATVLPNNGALYMGNHWRPFAFGGNPFTGNGLRNEKFDRESVTIDFNLKGRFGEDTLLGWMTNGARFEFGGNFTEYVYTVEQPDIFVSRLQNALMGYGGPSCPAFDRVATDPTSAQSFNRTIGIQSDIAPGTRGCQWFNPFASAWQTSIVSGAANPQYNSGAPNLAAGATPRPTGYQNSKELIDWMTSPRIAEFENQAATFNTLISGRVPRSFFELPGGEISWSLGSQIRVIEGEASQRNLNTTLGFAEQTMSVQDCPWPDRGAPVPLAPVPVTAAYQLGQPAQAIGTPGCASAVGPFYNAGKSIVSGAIPPYYFDGQTVGLFTEFTFPVLDNLNLTLNLRHDDYNGGDLIGDIYSIGGKYNITDNLYIRASNGNNYRADDALTLQPGLTSVTQVSQPRFGTGFAVQQAFTVDPDIGPEDDHTTNIGIGWDSGLPGGGRISASADFWEISVDGAVATSSIATVYNNVFGANVAGCQVDRSSSLCERTAGGVAVSGGQSVTGLPTTGLASGTQFANCNARLISFVDFTSPCQQGVTTSQNINFASQYRINGPSFVTNGIDYSVNVAYPMLDGTIAVQLRATNVMVYKTKGYGVNGILFDPALNVLGQANYTNVGNESREWRANGTVRWSNKEHNVSLRANYQSGTYNEAYDTGQIGAPLVIAASAANNVYSTYGYLPKDTLTFDINYSWKPTLEVLKGFEFRAVLLNVLDKDPQPAQSRTGYYPATGDPRGRILKLGVTKTF